MKGGQRCRVDNVNKQDRNGVYKRDRSPVDNLEEGDAWRSEDGQCILNMSVNNDNCEMSSEVHRWRRLLHALRSLGRGGEREERIELLPLGRGKSAGRLDVNGLLFVGVRLRGARGFVIVDSEPGILFG